MDDGLFSRRARSAPLVAVVFSSPDQVEAVHLGRVSVDGRDASDRVIALLESSPHLAGLRAVLLDGIAVGGFNVLDLGRISRTLGLAVVSVTRRPPDFERISAALRKYFPRDYRRRWSLVTAYPLFRVPTGGEPILAAAAGCSRAEATALLQRLTVRGFWPEPLRLAHLVAHAVGANSYPPGRRSTDGPVA